MIDADLGAIEARIGRGFENPALLREALTHSTYANENPDDGPHNERLEFLGDAVIDLLAADLLFEMFDTEPEGYLTRRRSRVVRKEALADLAKDLDLGSCLRLGEGQKRSAAGMAGILADAYEALAGALFVDGGYDAVRAHLGPTMRVAIERSVDPTDFKTRLQELCHRLGLDAPHYSVVRIEGPDHAKQFVCAVHIGDEACGEGTGSSKKIAEQVCARGAFEALEAAHRHDGSGERDDG